MADTLNDSLVKVTEELKEANTRSLEASKELGKVTAATKASYSSIGAAVKEAVGIDKLKDTIMNLPGMNVAKAVKDVVLKKRREKREQTNLAKRLGITRDQLLIQKAEQELVLAREEESKKVIEAAEKLGFNTDRIAKVNEEGNIELNGSLREANGQFVSKSNASAEANLRALKDFSKVQEKEVEQNKPEPKTRREDFSPVETTALDQTTLEKLATEDTLMMVADKMATMVSSPSIGGAPSISGAAASEDAGEERRITEAQLSEQEKQTSLLQQLVNGGLGGKNGEEEGGGFLSKLFDNFGNIGVGLLALKKTIGGLASKFVKTTGTLIRSGISAAGRGVGAVAKGVGGVAKGAATVGKGLLRGAAGAAKFIPGVGLAVTAAMGIFDGMSAGIAEYKKSGKLGAAVKEGIAGAASGLTFGLVSQESISAGMDKIGTFFSDGWTSFTDGVSTIAGGIADFAKDPLGTMSEVGTAISTKFTETVTSIKEGATALNTKFADLTGIDIGAGFKATTDLIKSGAAALGTKFTELTGIEIPTDFASLKTGIITGAAAIGTKFTELTGIEIPTDFASLKTSIVAGASALGTKFTELTGIEIPTDFASLKTSIVAGASALNTKFAELTGIDIGETFTGLKDKVLGVATGLNTKFAEVTGIDIGESLTGVKDSILGLGTKISEGFTGLFGEEGFSVEGVKTAIGNIGNKISEGFTGLFGEEGFSLAGVSTAIGTMRDSIGDAFGGIFGEGGTLDMSGVTDKISGMRDKIAAGLGAIGVPTFSEITEKASGIASSLSTRLEGLGLPTFSEAQSAMGTLASGLGSKISGMWDSVTSLFSSADKKQEEIDAQVAKEAALEEAEESGLYKTRVGRDNILDLSKVSQASDLQLQAILDDTKGTSIGGTNDMSSENIAAIEQELANRASAEPAVETVSSSFDGSTEVRRKNGRIEMMNLDQIDTALNLKKITNMEANAARNRISEEKSTRPAPPSISADAKQDVLSAMGNDTTPTTPLGMGSQSIPATVETAALSATTTASTLTYVPSRVDVNAREAAIGGYRPPNVDTNNISTSTLQQGASSVMHSDAVQLYTQKTMMLQQQGIDANTANAQVTAQMLSQNNTSVVNNNLGTNSLFYPVEAKDHTSSWNGGSSS